MTLLFENSVQADFKAALGVTCAYQEY